MKKPGGLPTVAILPALYYADAASEIFSILQMFFAKDGETIRIRHENILKSAKLFTNSLKYGFNRVKRQQLRNSIF